MKKHKQLGLTLIELLAVIATIAVLFVLLIPQINNSINKARVSGVQTDFRSYQIFGESYFTEHPGEEKTIEKFNTYLDKPLRFVNNKSTELNPWGNAYEIEVIPNGFKIISKSKMTANSFNDILYAENIIQHELLLLDENGEFASEVNGFDGKVVGEDNTTPTPEEEKPSATIISLSQNGNANYAETHSTELTVTNDKGINSVEYVWSQTNEEPSSGWQTTTSGSILSSSRTDDNVYLFVKAEDTKGKITKFKSDLFNQSPYLYTVGENGTTVTGYIGLAKDISIPNALGGKSVVSIGNSAFLSKQLTSVIIPNSVVLIGNASFGLNQLTSVVIPNSVTSIGTSSFRENQLNSVTLSNNLISIANHAFFKNPITSVSIPGSVKTIGTAAFSNNQLTSVNISDGVETIGNGAFSANQITSVTIPNSVTSIGVRAFAVNDLSSVVISDNVNKIEEDTFSFNKLTSVVIPYGVVSIDKQAFAENKLTSVTIPNTVTTIGHSAFTFNQLSSVNIPNSVTLIDEQAFAGNILTSITIPNSVTSIGTQAFSQNDLTSVTIPKNVTSLGDRVFYENFDLKNVKNCSNLDVSSIFQSYPTISSDGC